MGGASMRAGSWDCAAGGAQASPGRVVRCPKHRSQDLEEQMRRRSEPVRAVARLSESGGQEAPDSESRATAQRLASGATLAALRKRDDVADVRPGVA